MKSFIKEVAPAFVGLLSVIALVMDMKEVAIYMILLAIFNRLEFKQGG